MPAWEPWEPDQSLNFFWSREQLRPRRNNYFFQIKFHPISLLRKRRSECKSDTDLQVCCHFSPLWTGKPVRFCLGKISGKAEKKLIFTGIEPDTGGKKTEWIKLRRCSFSIFGLLVNDQTKAQFEIFELRRSVPNLIVELTAWSIGTSKTAEYILVRSWTCSKTSRIKSICEAVNMHSRCSWPDSHGSQRSKIYQLVLLTHDLITTR